jgi:hypothetical protein
MPSQRTLLPLTRSFRPQHDRAEMVWVFAADVLHPRSTRR